MPVTGTPNSLCHMHVEMHCVLMYAGQIIELPVQIRHECLPFENYLNQHFRFSLK